MTTMSVVKELIYLQVRRVTAGYTLTGKVLSQIRLHFKRPILVRNGGEKRALISYLTSPFGTQAHRGHSNQKEVVVMADVLAGLGFSVDAVDYISEFDIDYSKYDLIIGFGVAFSRSFSQEKYKGKRILHLTGANPNFSNEAEARRAKALQKRRGVLVSPRREAYWPWMFSAINSDAMFVLGNSWTLSTYSGLNENSKLIPVPYVEVTQKREIKTNFADTRFNFVWFAGRGALHKGLDLLLEAIVDSDINYHLDVCGLIGLETDFLALYQGLLFNNQRVSFHGFVDVASEKMRDIIATNAFVVFPSCSEGGGSSVITCMSEGLIPIVTKEASIDIGDFGILIEAANTQSIRDAMCSAASMSEDELRIRSAKCATYARQAHSYERYSEVLLASLLDILEE